MYWSCDLLVILATGKVTVDAPPELGVHVTVWRSDVRVRMPSFFLYAVRPTGVAMAARSDSGSGSARQLGSHDEIHGREPMHM